MALARERALNAGDTKLANQFGKEMAKMLGVIDTDG